MKKYLIVIILLLSTTCIFSQTGFVRYNFIAKPRVAYLQQTAELHFSQERSLFVWNKGPFKLVVQKDESTQQQDGYLQDEIGNFILKDFINDSLGIREIIWQQPYISSESKLPKFDWQIQEDSKKIGSFDCIKAITKFRGRDYEAWYARDIPISDGPWKFWGLPGLILECTDSKGDYSFKAEMIEIPSKAEVNIIPPVDPKALIVPFDVFINASDLEFEKMRRKNLAASESRGNSYEIKKAPENKIELTYDK